MAQMQELTLILFSFYRHGKPNSGLKVKYKVELVEANDATHSP